MTREKSLIIAARVLSLIFTPFYLPLLCIAVLFMFSYMNALPAWYKWRVLFTVYLFTILMPTLLIRAYRKIQGWTRFELGQKKRRAVPYFISILCYFLCIEMMSAQNIYFFIHCTIFSALLIQIACIIINMVWKVSTHMAAIGGLSGGILAFTHLFIYNPIWWFCVILLLSGLLGSARMILRQHTLAQVVAGFAIGFACAAFGILRSHFVDVVITIFKIIANTIIKFAL